MNGYEATKCNLENIIKTALQNLKTVTDANSVIGTPVKVDGNTVIPVSKLSFGFVGGGGDFLTDKSKTSNNAVSASGAGVSMSPIGFLVCGAKINYIKVDEEYTDDKWLNLIKNALNYIKN